MRRLQLTLDLFEAASREVLREGMVLLRGFADAPALLAHVPELVAVSPWRNMVTPGGKAMSVAMLNCGPLGWVSSRSGYSYEPLDPLTGAPWPAMPMAFLELAQRAAVAAGFAPFVPEACLVNRYVPGARMGLHQDRDEDDRETPIVSVSLGIPATFVTALGAERRAPYRKVQVCAGDVVVFGGPSRFAYHGVEPVTGEPGAERINLTFRRVNRLVAGPAGTE